MRSFKSNENIHKKEGGSYYLVSANIASSVTLAYFGLNSFHLNVMVLQNAVSPNFVGLRVWMQMHRSIGALAEGIIC